MKIILFAISIIYLTNISGIRAAESESKIVPTIKIASYISIETLFKDSLNITTPYTFNDFTHPQMGRSVVDYILISKALHLGGYDHKLEIIDCPNYARSLMLVNNGIASIMSETVWLKDTDTDKVYTSAPIIESGWIEKGIYSLPKRKDIQAISSLEELKKFTTLCSSNWTVDWQLHKSLQLPVHDVSQSTSMLRMLRHEYADYLFLAFPPTKDLTIKIIPYTPETPETSELASPTFEFASFDLYPTKGLKIQLPGSRHFVVSKKAPNADKIFNALQEGIKILKETGKIKQAYTDCGFINPHVKDWKCLNKINTKN